LKTCRKGKSKERESRRSKRRFHIEPIRSEHVICILLTERSDFHILSLLQSGSLHFLTPIYQQNKHCLVTSASALHFPLHVRVFFLPRFAPHVPELLIFFLRLDSIRFDFCLTWTTRFTHCRSLHPTPLGVSRTPDWWDPLSRPLATLMWPKKMLIVACRIWRLRSSKAPF